MHRSIHRPQCHNLPLEKSKAFQSSAIPHTEGLKFLFIQLNHSSKSRKGFFHCHEDNCFKLALVSFSHEKQFVRVRRGEEGDTVSKVFCILCELKSLLSIKIFKNQRASTQLADFLHLKKST